MSDKLLETIGNIEYWETMTGYEARYKNTTICNHDLNRLKQDAPAAIDMIRQWRAELIKEE